MVIISTVRSTDEFLKLDAKHKLGFLRNPKVGRSSQSFSLVVYILYIIFLKRQISNLCFAARNVIDLMQLWISPD